MSTGVRTRCEENVAGASKGPSRSRLIAARLLLVLVAVLAPLAALEAAFRVAGPFIPGNYDTGSYLTRHPRYGHYHPPSYSGWIKRDEYTVQVRTNPERQRGPAVPFERTPGTFRILVLGDSFVEAAQVAEHERFIARLQELLNAGGGCGGWSAVQELLYLQEEGPRYKPDLVLLAFFTGNDVANNSYELELEGNVNAALKPYFERQAGGQVTLSSPTRPRPHSASGSASSCASDPPSTTSSRAASSRSCRSTTSGHTGATWTPRWN